MEHPPIHHYEEYCINCFEKTTRGITIYFEPRDRGVYIRRIGEPKPPREILFPKARLCPDCMIDPIRNDREIKGFGPVLARIHGYVLGFTDPLCTKRFPIEGDSFIDKPDASHDQEEGDGA